jgi:uncharacterized protein YggU (UPF0235/DUF167 family)
VPVRLEVRVKPRSRRPGVEKTDANSYRVEVAAAPEKGRANREVLERLAEALDIPVSRLRIVRGETSPDKLVEVQEP